MLHDFLAMDLGDSHPRKGIPKTEALVAQKVDSFRSDPLAYWWHRAFEDGKVEFVNAESEWPDAFTVGSQGKGDMLDSLETSARPLEGCEACLLYLYFKVSKVAEVYRTKKYKEKPDTLS